MKGKTMSKFVALAAAIVLATTACAPALAPASETLTANEGVVQTISRDLVSTLERPKEAAVESEVASTPAVAAAQVGEGEALEDALTSLYRQANPSVVYILVTSGGSGFSMTGGSGTGWVYSADGKIVTNAHVVEAGGSYEIVFPNGDRMEAELIGADPDSDLAVLQVESLPAGVAPLPLGDSDSVQVGEFAIAIGNPFGEQSSMSLGIISGLDRSLPSQRMTTTGSTYSLPQVIQTDAPINPGNSGGPLLNLEGEVIGVNAAIASTTGTNSGVGFSIPVNVVKRVIPSLIEDGEVAYPYMGVSFDGELTLSDMELYDIPQTRGAYVISVTPGSPAADAGLVAANPETGRGGDLITAIDGRSIDTFADLNGYLVLEAAVGQTINLTVIRDGETITVPLTLGARP
ncbi:MAG: trypsin-like peptidase domain-containing protein [Anaerolineae bacterium]|nr:trypsin-like peptidase domain-containing protein [Anaerolineae bacterium]